MADVTCPICRAPIPPQVGRGRPRVYCGASCKRRAANAARREHRRRLVPVTMADLMERLAVVTPEWVKEQCR